ncbi:hypothetical protein SNEBB_002102 [Seison nebaliae]|nr:hypothetical protein SNEBB_002102 [Seison nebaliae]
MSYWRNYNFKQTAKKQYRRLSYGFKRYGVYRTHKIVFDRNDPFDKAVLLVIDISIFYIVLALTLIVAFAVANALDKNKKDADLDTDIPSNTGDTDGNGNDKPAGVGGSGNDKPVSGGVGDGGNGDEISDGTKPPNNGNFPSIGSADENILGRRNPFKKYGCADPRFESLSSYHTACLPASPDLNRIVKYTDEYRLQILELHMKERRLVPASDMKRLYYDLHLEQTAERWAARCQFGHEYTSKYRSEPLYAGPVGQCMGKGVSGETVHDTLGAVGRFIAEKKYYRYGKMPIGGKEIGHYTMVIFSNASRVGCGESFCTTGSYIICNYFKSITGMDLELPYFKGKPCSRCPRECKCWQKMCDCGTTNGQ